MTRTELIRRRRQMHQRIRDTVAERRMAVALHPPPTPPIKDDPADQGPISVS